MSVLWVWVFVFVLEMVLPRLTPSQNKTVFLSYTLTPVFFVSPFRCKINPKKLYFCEIHEKQN